MIGWREYKIQYLTHLQYPTHLYVGRTHAYIEDGCIHECLKWVQYTTTWNNMWMEPTTMSVWDTLALIVSGTCYCE